MLYPDNLSSSDKHWFDLIQECRTSGKSDKQWLAENNISSPTFYYHIKKLREKACAIPPSNKAGLSEVQEIVPLIIEDQEPITSQISSKMSSDKAAIRLTIHGISVEIMNSATQESIQNTIAALSFLC